KPVDDVVENSRINYVLKTGEAELSEIQHIGEISIVTNRVPIVVEGEVIGVVATFQELEKIQKVESQIRKKLFLKGHIAKARFADIIGESKAIIQAKEKGRQYAEVDSTIMILGETGTGKELFAQSIHNASPREDKPFVAVNCAALPENLLESELFGYVEGAFTGARKGGKAGLFELAHGGTIFLDEISEMSPKLQARFLRVLQEKEVVRLGDDRVIPVDVRVIAASNRDLYNQVEKGDFREDLYYRLCVLRLEIPPLRKRTSDISYLVNYFIQEKSRKLSKSTKGITPDAMRRLVIYDWPGNVRHLENIIERSIVICKSEEIDIDIVCEAMGGAPGFSCGENDKAGKDTDSVITANKRAINQIEYDMINKILEENKGNKMLTAEKLGISVTTLWRKIKKLEENNDV
ncbi:MAG: sigma 54-interacting transcriptional regulator, partial [Clostridiaceae bacterium]|nr:sigma 54-interacting transcriptional regulator [Clostridiaceae bacterium]